MERCVSVPDVLNRVQVSKFLLDFSISIYHIIIEFSLQSENPYFTEYLRTL